MEPRPRWQRATGAQLGVSGPGTGGEQTEPNVATSGTSVRSRTADYGRQGTEIRNQLFFLCPLIWPWCCHLKEMPLLPLLKGLFFKN